MMRAAISARLALVTIALLSAATTCSLAQTKSKDWQTGTLVSRELLVPADKRAQPAGCRLLPFTVYTVDTSNYRYQFIGFPISFSPGSPTLAITFRVDSYDDDVYLRDPKTKHVLTLRLFRKLPRLSSSESPVLASNKQLKHRDWTPANISAAEPVFLSPFMLKLMTPTDSPPPLCSEDFIVAWKYVVQAQGKAYTFDWHGRNALDVTVGGVSEFALGKHGYAYLIDDSGRERKVRLNVIGKNVLQ